MALLKQSTAYTRTFFMVSSSDHLSAKTAASPVVNISKAGGAFGAAAGAVTEIANGWYKVALTAADTNTLGDLSYHITGTGADDTDFVDQVSVRITDDLMFPNISGRGVDVDATGGVEITVDQSVNVNKWLTVTPNPLVGGRVDVIGVVRTGTATASSASSLTLDAGAPATADYFRNDILVMTSGAALGQSRRISTYSVGRVATVSPNWDTTPGATDTFAIIGEGRKDLAEWVGVVPDALSSGKVSADIKLWLTVAPSALISGNVPSNVQAMAVDVIDATALALSAGQEIADRTLARNLAGGSDAGRVVRDALRALRNKVDAGAGIVYAEDDSTTAWTFTITTAPGNPVTVVDPA